VRAEDAAELVSAAIDAAVPEGPAVLVAIDGPGGSGKSTLAGELALLRDDVAIIDGDDFYRPLGESTRAALTPLEAVDLLFDWERLRDEALAPLVRGEDARYRRYDWPSERLGEDVATVAAHGVVVIEGVYVARPALRGHYDLIVVVEAPRELCLARQLARGENEPEQIARWRAAEEWYLERQDPKRVADLVIDGS
jgi:uridine kinase